MPSHRALVRVSKPSPCGWVPNPNVPFGVEVERKTWMRF
jgi:hypothetical protein